MLTMRSGSGNGSGFKTTESMIEKMAVFPARQSPSVATVVMVNPRSLMRSRRANFRSWRIMRPCSFGASTTMPVSASSHSLERSHRPAASRYRSANTSASSRPYSSRNAVGYSPIRNRNALVLSFSFPLEEIPIPSRPARQQPRGTRIRQQPFQASCFSSRHRTPELRQTVVTSPLVIVFRIRSFRELFDQTVLEQSANGGVQTAGTQTKRAVCALEHVSHHGISVPILIGERDKYLKSISMQGKKRFRPGELGASLPRSHRTSNYSINGYSCL